LLRNSIQISFRVVCFVTVNNMRRTGKVLWGICNISILSDIIRDVKYYDRLHAYMVWILYRIGTASLFLGSCTLRVSAVFKKTVTYIAAYPSRWCAYFRVLYFL
jgi:hypothetical protein